MNRIKKGDTVVVISGVDKNRHGKVLKLFTKRKTAIVENMRLLKKCIRANPNQGITGAISSKEFPIPLSKLMLYNPTIDKRDRMSIKVLSNNQRVRCFRSNNETVDVHTEANHG